MSMRARVRSAGCLLLALAAAACTDTADLTPVNGQAQAVGSPTGAAAAVPGSKGNFAASARGPRTSLVCGGNLVAGHGTADCRDQNGAIYRINL